jgi:Xaa-Pro aminopeptidase
MDEAGLDAVFVTERNNYRYFTGHRTLQFGNKMRPMTVLLPRDRDPALMIYGLEAPEAREQGWIDDIRTYVDVPFPPDLVADTLKDLGLANGRIGCELGSNQRLWLTYQDFEAIKAGVPTARFVDGAAVFVRSRLRKSELEIARIEEACRITQVAYEVVKRRVHPGMTVAQCERTCLEALVDAGSDPDTPGFAIVGAGLGRDHVFRTGDWFFCDFGASYRGYKADMTRLATFGPPTDRQRAAFGQIVKIQDAVIRAMRPGVRASDIARICNRELQAIGEPPLQGSKRIGHGVGLDLQEPPSLNLVDDTVLEQGVTLTPEPRFARDGGLIMVEESVVITADGVRALSQGYQTLHAIEA